MRRRHIMFPARLSFRSALRDLPDLEWLEEAVLLSSAGRRS
ncbi:hypothetical protein [Sinorhizobium meliloti]|nr:hypothetical protein [Sinorhizobium meliloti]